MNLPDALAITVAFPQPFASEQHEQVRQAALSVVLRHAARTFTQEFRLAAQKRLMTDHSATRAHEEAAPLRGACD